MRLIITPGTILRRRRDLLRRRGARKSRPKGRPRTRRNVETRVLRTARENDGWGYRRIAGELASLGIELAPSTVWAILKKAGIDPAPRRNGPTWTGFLRSQAEAMILATDFFTVDLLDGTAAHVLTMIEHAIRPHPCLGRHRASHGRVDDSNGPQRADGPRRVHRAVQVPDQQDPSPADERLRRTPGAHRTRRISFRSPRGASLGNRSPRSPPDRDFGTLPGPAASAAITESRSLNASRPIHRVMSVFALQPLTIAARRLQLSCQMSPTGRPCRSVAS